MNPAAPVTETQPAALTSGKQAELLVTLYQHRLMSTSQLHRLHGDGRSLRSTHLHLAALHDAGLAARHNRPRRPTLWYVTARGAELAELADVRRRTYRMRPEVAAGQIAAHTLAVNELGCLLAEAARRRGDEFGPRDWEHEIAHPYRPAPPNRAGTDHLVIADAVLSYTANNSDGSQLSLVRFVELDRGTCSIEVLVGKIRRYGQMRDYRSAGAPAWRRRYTAFPRLLIVLDGLPSDRLTRRRRTLIDLAREEPDIIEHADALGATVCSLAELAQQGPFTAIFHPLVAHGEYGDVGLTFFRRP